MNKAELIDVVTEKLGSDRRQATAAVEHIVDTIVRAVHKGDSVTITGFGVFEQRRRAARVARNPRTGETVKVKPTSVPAFRPGAQFKAVVSGAQKLPADGPAVKRGAFAGAVRKAVAKRAVARKALAKKVVSKVAATRVPAKKVTATKVTATKAPAKKVTRHESDRHQGAGQEGERHESDRHESDRHQGAGQESDCRQEGPGQKGDRHQSDRRQEGPGQESDRHESDRHQGADQEGPQVDRREVRCGNSVPAAHLCFGCGLRRLLTVG